MCFTIHRSGRYGPEDPEHGGEGGWGGVGGGDIPWQLNLYRALDPALPSPPTNQAETSPGRRQSALFIHLGAHRGSQRGCSLLSDLGVRVKRGRWGGIGMMHLISRKKRPNKGVRT